ncbi:hypothetical protein B0H10DRAFT_1287215 [Mycena sp. CBHHK59/15]|nr:hypothetical protein B0H10DRAFT_1287215 [Mycena sp. CBHHK59/15]
MSPHLRYPAVIFRTGMHCDDSGHQYPCMFLPVVRCISSDLQSWIIYFRWLAHAFIQMPRSLPLQSQTACQCWPPPSHLTMRNPPAAGAPQSRTLGAGKNNSDVMMLCIWAISRNRVKPSPVGTVLLSTAATRVRNTSQVYNPTRLSDTSNGEGLHISFSTPNRLSSLCAHPELYKANRTCPSPVVCKLQYDAHVFSFFFLFC